MAALVVLSAALSCQVQEMPEAQSTPGTKTLIVHTQDADTKTAVVLESGAYKSWWKAGDKIKLIEYIEANHEDSKEAPYALVYDSNALASDTKAAYFYLYSGSSCQSVFRHILLRGCLSSGQGLFNCLG